MTTPHRLVPTRTFLPLADSPLLALPSQREQDTALALLLAEHGEPEPALLGPLLTITDPDTSERIAATLDTRTDLSPSALALLVAHRPDLQQTTARLKNLLFPDRAPAACCRFARTVAALVHTPETIDHTYLSSARFTVSARSADPGMLHTLLEPLLDTPVLIGPADAALGALLDARRTTDTPVTDVDLAGAAARERTRHSRVRTALAARREHTIGEIAQATGGLTRAAQLWYDALLDTADTPEQAGQALATACTAGHVLATNPDADSPWPSARARWHQVTAAARSPRTPSPVWEQAWATTATTPDGSVWDPAQRPLVTGYTLLADHVLTHHTTTDPPTPAHCWATDPDGRNLLHTVADHLTGHHGHSPLDHFDDQLLITFVRALAKNRRDLVPGDLHVHGLIAAVKAARSKTSLLTRSAPINLGIVIPMRAETHHIAPPGPRNPDGQDALTAKVAQLAWLLEVHPEARAELLLVDEDPDSASAHAAWQAYTGAHPQIRLTVTTRPDTTSTKGGAVLWGLAQLHGAGHHVIAYTDLDLAYPLDQLGLHLHALDQPGTGAAVGSRRRTDSHGYYPPTGPTPTTRLYQQAVHELLNLHTTDPQAGFKAFTATALHTALPHVTDHGLSFDTELLAALTAAGHAVTDVGVAALHRWTDTPAATPRDYDAMLRAVHEQALRHRLAPGKTPVWDKIRAAGSLAAACRSDNLPILPTPR